MLYHCLYLLCVREAGRVVEFLDIMMECELFQKSDQSIFAYSLLER